MISINANCKMKSQSIYKCVLDARDDDAKNTHRMCACAPKIYLCPITLADIILLWWTVGARLLHTRLQIRR